MDYARLIKKLGLPGGFTAPESLVFDDLRARPLSRADLKDDLAAANASAATIRKTRGGGWPEGELSIEFNELDLAWHEREFRDGESFAYVVYDAAGRYIGCFYLYPLGVRTPLTPELVDYDVDASWWVTTEAYAKGYYEKLYRAVQQWLTDEFPFKEVYYSNEEIPD